MERFTRRAPTDWTSPLGKDFLGGNAHVKTIANPRIIHFIYSAHYPVYFESRYSINENGGVATWCNIPPTAEKIVTNHYNTKSQEEYKIKHNRGRADILDKDIYYLEEEFKNFDRNEIFDDGILKYRNKRAKNFRLPDNSHADERLFDALAKNLSPTLLPNTPQEFYAGKMETFLTCRAVSAYLQKKLTDATPAKFFEEAALVAILKSLKSMTFADARLLLSELPELLTLPYPVVDDLRKACIQFIPLMMNVMRLNNSWLNYVELDYIQRLLKIQK